MGVFTPGEISVSELNVGHVGFVITGVKEAAQVQIGETIFKHGAPVEPVEGKGKSCFASVDQRNRFQDG